MAPGTRGVKRKQATTEEETTVTKSKTQTRVAKGKQPGNKEETTVTKSNTQAVGEATKGKGKGSVAAKGKGKGSVAAKGKGKGTATAKGKGKGKGTVAAKGKGKTTQEKSGSPNSPFNPASHSYVSPSDSSDEDYYHTDDDHYDSPPDRELPSKEEVMEISHNKIEIIKKKGVGDEEYKALITKLKRLRKFKDTPLEEVYQAAVDLMSSKKERVTVTEEKVTELLNWYVNLRLTELAVVITTLLKTRDWDMEVAFFVKDMAEKYLKLLKLKLPRLEKLYDTADDVSKLKEGSHLFPEAIQTLRLDICTWIWERYDDYDSTMRGAYNLEHIC